MVLVGLHDGNVAVYNLQTKSRAPVFQSSPRNGKHRDVVWQVAGKSMNVWEKSLPKVKWAPDNLDGYLNFFSVSADGRVTNWTIVKTNLWYSDILELPFNKELVHVDNDELEILGMYEIDFIFETKFINRWRTGSCIQARWWFQIFGWNRFRNGLLLYHRVQFRVSGNISCPQHPHLHYHVEHLHPHHLHH